MSLLSSFNTSFAGKDYISGQAVVDSGGTCEIDIPQPPSSEFWTGGITVYDSPVDVSWTVYINSLPVDIFVGTNTCSGLQVGPNDQLKIIALGMTDQIGKTFHALFNVITSPADNTPLLIPGHDSLSSLKVAGSLLYQSGALPVPGNGAAQTPFINVSSFATIIVVAQTTAATDCTISLSWAPTQAGPGTILSQLDAFSKNSANVNSYIPFHVIMPWVSIVISNLGAANTSDIFIIGVPQGENTGFTTPPSAVINMQNQNIAGVPAHVLPSVVIPGKYLLWYQSNGSGSIAVNIQSWRPNVAGASSATWDYLYAFTTPATANTPNAPASIYLPASDWRLELGVGNGLYVAITGPVS